MKAKKNIENITESSQDESVIIPKEKGLNIKEKEIKDWDMENANLSPHDFLISIIDKHKITTK